MKYIYLILSVIFFTGCFNGKAEKHEDHHDEHHDDHGEEVHLSELQFKNMNMELGKLQKMDIGEYVMTNGTLEVPPQNDAAVTAIIGANIKKIYVIEGEKVKKGQLLAYLYHPDLIKLQTDYQVKSHQLEFLKEEFERQKKLYDEKVGSGKEYQKASADYYSTLGDVNGLSAQIKMLGLNASKIKSGQIFENVPVYAPLSGYIKAVGVKTGQYVLPQTEMFHVINLEDIHVDLMVYEKDVAKVKEGQKVIFTTEMHPEKIRTASIFNIGRAFEEGPKAVHLHADIHDLKEELISGTYVRGKIMFNSNEVSALPKAAVVQEGTEHFVFTVEKEGKEWSFKPVQVNIGNEDNGQIEIKLLEEVEISADFALNNAYYLMAEMKKAEAEHHH
ncbi:efflux RND transporter periplasmic adaptor subunit [Flammeovirga yaeyamensis]|uniref:Efflux RND transporter periplasmic adaptor subunit n=1 Tax=Flammeovirga yaeyamensis TaxID=367791 RepID=A0AAX1MZQ8_9BACT|nr:efflux RND transporter periplasmic adaptor subunit [Flammeovirga yaeyamensis]MBB3695909.1 cobalt-zinc-cadmium efflux system membrane fusion protein [Flammeovirga yaeyamensis]NMF34598.1 efflux RND transporter periplasmic adaptor subunit [Flammeovirga yaeyamensis]QWG00572.1 efflux RND transporter periplasmic adaptor subunit [Flammeovirga yaeyamensis]